MMETSAMNDENNSSWLTPKKCWGIAVVSWLGSEGVGCWIQHLRYPHGLWSVSFFYIPFMALIPLVAGVHLKAKTDRMFAIQAGTHTTKIVSLSVAIMVAISYAVLTACFLGFA